MVFDQDRSSGYGQPVYVAFKPVAKQANCRQKIAAGWLDGTFCFRTNIRDIWIHLYLLALNNTSLGKGWVQMLSSDFTDAINNGAMNFVMWDVNLLNGKLQLLMLNISS